MQFIKKHYEKVLLSIVLLGLAVAAAWLPWQVSTERDRLAEILRNSTVRVKAKPFKPLDDWLATNKMVMAKMEHFDDLDFSGPHNLFNPVQWKKMADGRLVPYRTGSEWGAGALKILQIRPLSLTVSFDKTTPGLSPGDPPKYEVTITNEKERNSRGDQRTVSLAIPHLSAFELLGVQGPTNDPTGLVLKLKDDFEPITVLKSKPFSRIADYAVDLEYPPARQTQRFLNKRKGDEIRLEGDSERYKIVAITPNEVVLSADSNKRRTIIKYHASNATASNR